MKKGKLTIIFGGQFGSEGKGQVAAFIQQTDPCATAVRVGGPNAGHTFYMNNGNDKVVVQSIPVAAYFGALGMIGPAGYVLLDQLEIELKRGLELTGRALELIIDPMAVIINASHMASESMLKDRIGSTGEGVGAATAQKIMREPTITVGSNAAAIEAIRKTEWGRRVGINTTSPSANVSLKTGFPVMIEGTQGYGLSLHTGGYYPYCTSRECTPQALLAETGIGAHNAGEVESVMVLRTFPIRVGGNSGPLPHEITWEELSKRTGGYVSTPERTTVTKKIRRIAEFDYDLVGRAIEQCGPTSIALMFYDYLDPLISGIDKYDFITRDTKDWLDAFEERMGVPVKYLGTGPGRTVEIPEKEMRW